MQPYHVVMQPISGNFSILTFIANNCASQRQALLLAVWADRLRQCCHPLTIVVVIWQYVCWLCCFILSVLPRSTLVAMKGVFFRLNWPHSLHRLLANDTAVDGLHSSCICIISCSAVLWKWDWLSTQADAICWKRIEQSIRIRVYLYFMGQPWIVRSYRKLAFVVSLSDVTIAALLNWHLLCTGQFTWRTCTFARLHLLT